MHTLVEALWPTLLIGLAGLLLLYLVHAGPLVACISGALRLGGRSRQAEKLAMMSEPATRCEVCLQETTMQCSRCKLVKYCSPECQRKHWNRGHKVDCQPKSAAGAPSANGRAKKSVQKQHANAVAGPSSTVAKRMLFPYSEFVDLFNWRELVREPCGLVNVGNSCYANAVLQCLTYTWPLAGYLLQQEHSAECEKSSTEFCFLCEFEGHVNRALRGSVPIMPQRILARVRNVGASLGYGRQEDAHEFMRFAVDSMQATFLEEAGGEKNIDHATQETTLIHHIFGGKLQSQVKCMTCLAESNTYESVLDLTVEITGSVNSLEGALHTFTSPEWLDGDNKYKCDKCNDYVRGCKRLSIHEGPNMLSVVLKRFQGGHFGKVNKAIAYPETLNLTPFMSGKGDKPGAYHLYGVIVHLDMLNSTFFGHYLCFVKDAAGRWYEADDSDVTATTIDRVLAQKAYMLFYARSEPRPAPLLQSSPHIAPPSRNGIGPLKVTPSHSHSPSSVLTTEGIPLHSNGDATSADSNGSVEGAPANGAKGPQANGTTLRGDGITSAKSVVGAEANGSGEVPEAIYTKGVVAQMLKEADNQTAFTPSGAGIGDEAVGESTESSSAEDEEGGRFADSILLDEPYPAAADNGGSQKLGATQGGGNQSPAGCSDGSSGKPVLSKNEGGNQNEVSGERVNETGGSSRPIVSTETSPEVIASVGSQNLGASVRATSSGRNGLGNTQGVGRPGAVQAEANRSGSESRKRTAAEARGSHSTAQSERAASAGVRAQQNGVSGVNGHLMGSSSTPALVSQPGASQGAPLQMTSALGERLMDDGESAGVRTGVGNSGRMRGGAAGESGLASSAEEPSASANAHVLKSASKTSVSGGPSETARGKKRSTHQATSGTASPLGGSANGLPIDRGVFTQDMRVFASDGGVFTQESQLEELSRLLSNRPLDTALDSDVWESVLGTGLPNPAGSPNPPLPDESFLEDEELEAVPQPEPLFLPAENAGPFGGFAANGASIAEAGVNTEAAANKNESAGPFGLGSIPFTPIFTSQPSGKEGGRVKHAGTNSGLARGFFGPAKAKRKSDKRPVRAPEAVVSVAPPEDEAPVVGGGFEESFDESGPEVGFASDENQQPFLDVPGDELVLTTDTSTDEKKSSGNNVKPKGIADLIENEDLLREVGKSADQRLRSVVKGKVEAKSKQGRNDVCNCGSGKKWKKCHGKGVAA